MGHPPKERAKGEGGKNDSLGLQKNRLSSFCWYYASDLGTPRHDQCIYRSSPIWTDMIYRLLHYCVYALKDF